MAATSARPSDNLPADLTSFVGRRPEIKDVRQLLGTSRLVTLTGLGGVGKTRLAMRVARDARRTFADGVFLVELAALKDAELLPHTVIDALKISEGSARAPMDALCDYLRHRHVLLVLDNCEHLLQATAVLADAVLRAGPRVRILATSRQALMIAGEHVYPVRALPVPDPDAPLAGGATTYPALALFADRAAAVVPGFTITRENEAAVIRVCHRLEGIPLAIELAAVRLRVLRVNDLASRLDSRFQLLTQGSRTAPVRHQTLEATIDWSYELCSPAEQTLWERASVFAGSFALDAIETVCSDQALPKDSILDIVAGLTDKSILLREQFGSHVRFRMLETIREYGLARLRDATTAPALRRRHRDWYPQMLERVCAEWFGSRQEEWATWLDVEHANIRSALEFCLLRPEEVRSGLRMAGAPWFLWLACGYVTEGRHWLDRALRLDTAPSPERAWALGTYGYIAVLQGDENDATTTLEECRALADELQDPAALAYATHLLGLCGMLKEDLSVAASLLLEGRQRYEGSGVPDDYPNALRVHLSTCYLLMGEVDKAWELVEELRRACEQRGERWLLSYANWGAGFVKLARGQLEAAETDMCQSLKIKSAFHDTLGLALALDLLSWITVAKGEFERGAVLLGSASQVWQGFGVLLFGSKELTARRGQFEEMARRAIGSAAFDAAFARGRNLTMDEMLAFALRERGTTPAVQSQRGPSDLTPREREIADLVADGMTNKEIAAKLVISQRTAEGHVEHILAKLGFSSRAAIAAWVAEQRAAAGI